MPSFENPATSSVNHFLLCGAEPFGRPLLPQGFVLFVAQMICSCLKSNCFSSATLSRIHLVTSCSTHMCSRQRVMRHLALAIKQFITDGCRVSVPVLLHREEDDVRLAKPEPAGTAP